MNLDIEAWKQFAVDHWVVIVIAIVALFLILNVVKTMVKWALVAVIVIGVLVYGGITVNDLKEVGGKVKETVSDVGGKVTAELKDEAIKAMASEAKDAKYTLNADGTYTVKSDNLELNGTPNSGEVNVKFRSMPLGTWKMEGAVRDLVVSARASSR